MGDGWCIELGIKEICRNVSQHRFSKYIYVLVENSYFTIKICNGFLLFSKVIFKIFTYGKYAYEKRTHMKVLLGPRLFNGIKDLRGLRITGPGLSQYWINNLNHYFPAAQGLKLCKYPPLLPSPFFPIAGPGVAQTRTPLPQIFWHPDLCLTDTSVPASPHPSPLPGHSPPSRALAYPTHTGPLKQGSPHSGSPAPRVSLVLHPPSSTPTRQAGCGVDPLEQLCSAQLAPGVGVRRLDGLAHAHLCGRRPLQLHGSSGVRSDRAWAPPGHRPGPPQLQRALSRCPEPASRALAHQEVRFKGPGMSRGEWNGTLHWIRGDRGWQSWNQLGFLTCKGEIALTSEDCAEN